MSIEITAVHATEILDSRGRPTLSVSLRTADGATHRAGVPSGASTSSGEAVELRDGDAARYRGKGTRTAVGNVNGPISEAMAGRSFADLATLDQALIDLDGTEDTSRLGANAIVGVSMAAAPAFAATAREPLRRYLTPEGVTAALPVVNGGAHAPNSLDFQEFMLAPLGASSYAEAVRAGAPRSTPHSRHVWRQPGSPPGWATRADSHPTSPSPRTCSRPWSAPSATPATPQGGMVSPLRSTRPPASSTVTAATTSPVSRCPATR